MKCFLLSEGILSHYFLPGNHRFTITIKMLIALFTFIHLPDFMFVLSLSSLHLHPLTLPTIKIILTHLILQMLHFIFADQRRKKKKNADG